MPRVNALPMNRDDFTESDRRRFWAKVSIGTQAQCWEWTAGKSPFGYGRFGWHPGAVRWAHRVAFVLEYGDCPTDLVIDHLCRNRGCCNPAHMEAVTHETNISRGVSRSSKVTACPKGHPYTFENTRLDTNRDGVTRRACRECQRIRMRKRKDQPDFSEKQKAYRARTREHRRALPSFEAGKARARDRERERVASLTPEQRLSELEALRVRSRASYLRRKAARDLT